METTTELVIILVLVLMNGFFAGAEIAVLTARRNRLQQAADQGNKGAKAAMYLIGDTNRFLSTVQVGITGVGTLAAAYGGVSLVNQLSEHLATLSTPAIASNSRAISLAVVTGGIAFTSLILGELVPKRAALAYAERLATIVAPPMALLSLVARPFVAVLGFVTALVLRILRVDPEAESSVSVEDIEHLIESGREQGILQETEHEVALEALQLRNRRVRDIMRARVDIDAVDIETPTEEIVGVMAMSGFSRLPVYEGSLDHIIGFLYNKDVFQQFYAAGIQVKIITGDNALTTAAIAQQTGFRGSEKTINGDDMMKLDDAALRTAVNDTNIFTRMFPEAKLRIINALQAEGHVVAMTGDGVNDGPALKAAHIGIAMGKRGSELAKEAASLILVNDDLGNMVDAVAMGRKIYGNLKKAIQYIISIHIPIILTVALPLFLGWVYPTIFTPLHVIFLELIMGPTCSIVYENEPLEADGMRRPPRPLSLTFLTWKELSISIWQGLVITLGTLGSYQLAVQQGLPEEGVRAMVFSTLVIANIGLTLVNRSFTASVLSTFRNRNNLLRNSHRSGRHNA